MLAMIRSELDRRTGRGHSPFSANSGLHIVGEYFLPIHFQLMRAWRALAA